MGGAGASTVLFLAFYIDSHDFILFSCRISNPIPVHRFRVMHHIALRTGWLFLFAVLMAAGLLFTMVFFVRLFAIGHKALLKLRRRCPSQIIMFSDLECDYINPIDLCNKLNQVCISLPLWLLQSLHAACQRPFSY